MRAAPGIDPVVLAVILSEERSPPPRAEPGPAAVDPELWPARPARLSGGPGAWEALRLEGPGILEELSITGPCSFRVSLVVDGYELIGWADDLPALSPTLSWMDYIEEDTGATLHLRKIRWIQTLTLRVDSPCHLEGAALLRQPTPAAHTRT